MIARVKRHVAAATRSLRRRYGLLYQGHDRYLLEECIFAELRARSDVRTLLFVGCDTYTEQYAEMFAGRTFITIDTDPAKARYGSPGHIIDSFANLEAHFPQESLDAVICNGVIGWGLDRAEEIDRAAFGTFRCLRPGGIFIVGWNDIAPRRPVSFDELDGFRRFERVTMHPFPASVYPTLDRLRHVYSFYVRPPE